VACCRYFEREQFHSWLAEVAFVGPQVTQCIKFMSGQSDKKGLTTVVLCCCGAFTSIYLVELQKDVFMDFA